MGRILLVVARDKQPAPATVKCRLVLKAAACGLVHQMPKSRGFRAFDNKAFVVSLSQLNVFNDGETVNLKSLIEKGLVKSTTKRVKILAGEIKKKVSVKLPISASAKTAVEKAGGKVL